MKILCSLLVVCLLALAGSSVLPESAIAGPPEPGSEPPRIGIPVSTEAGMISPAFIGCGGVIAPAINADYEQEVVELVNSERANVGRPPLKRVTNLVNAGRYHAADMRQDNYFDHNSYDRSGGNLVQVCSVWDRISSYYTGWQALAENIARGQSTPEVVMSAWMNSQGHRDNILSTDTWEIGVGYYKDAQSSHYWVQDFGRRFDVYPIVINREAAATDSINVTLYIYGQGTWTEMRLRNDNGSWTAWMPFQSNLNWTLSSAGGERTVWVEMRDATGQTTTSSDAITLSGQPILGGLPDAVHFVYSIPDQHLLPASWQLTPQNIGNSGSLSWQLTPTGSWFDVSPVSGSTPGSFWITPDNFDAGSVGTYTGEVTVTVVNPGGVLGSPHQIGVSLAVVNTPFDYVYLPLIRKD